LYTFTLYSKTHLHLIIYAIQACECHPEGSVDTQCDQSSGLCPCKQGVGNGRCDSCLPTYYNLTADGCSRCACSDVGSTADTCHAV